MAAEAPPEQRLREKYLEKLVALRGMGFRDEAKCVQALEDAKGSLEGAVVLLAKRATSDNAAAASAKPATDGTADGVTRGARKAAMGDEAPMERVTLPDLIAAFPKIDKDDLRTIHLRYQGEYDPIMAEIKQMSSG